MARNNRNYSGRGALASLLIVVLAAMGFVGWQDVTAFNPQPDPPGFSGMVGITHGQMARLNAVNVSRQPIEVKLFFLDRTGARLQEARALLRPGEATFLDLSRTLVGDAENRVAIRAVVQGIGNPDLKRPSVIPTLEIVDEATGATLVLYEDFIGDPSDG